MISTYILDKFLKKALSDLSLMMNKYQELNSDDRLTANGIKQFLDIQIKIGAINVLKDLKSYDKKQ